MLVNLTLRISSQMTCICASSVTKPIINLSKPAIQSIFVLWSAFGVGVECIDEGILRFIKCDIQQILLDLLVNYELGI